MFPKNIFSIWIIIPLMRYYRNVQKVAKALFFWTPRNIFFSIIALEERMVDMAKHYVVIGGGF